MLSIKATCAVAFAAAIRLSAVEAQVPYPETFSLDDVLDVPLVSGLVGSPSGDRLAWISEQRGRRNVWVAVPPAAPRRVTNFEDDDGKLIGELLFSHDGRWLVFGRGGRVNNKGEVYNPLNLPDPVANTFWYVPVDGGDSQHRESGSMSSVAFAPDGRLFSTHGKQVWAQGSVEAEPQRLLTVQGSVASLTPSPDGTRLAFVSSRGGYGRGMYSFVGVFDFAARTVTYMAPSIEVDRQPVWSPDGSQIAFVRIPFEPKSYRFTDFSDVVPWSIVVANPDTGEGRAIWTADSGDGSYFQAIRGGSLYWGAGRLVFPWEKTGWKLLYSISANGGQPLLLTPGQQEVASAILTDDGRTVVYTSNFGDMERQHIWKVPVAGGKPQQITSGDGVEGTPVLLNSGQVAYLAHRADAAPGIELLAGNGDVQPLAVESQGGDVFSRFVKPEVVSFAAPDGLRIYGHLYRPTGKLAAKSHPVLVYVHGGCHSKSYPVFRSPIKDGIFQYLASRGYFVFVVNFRSGTGRGLEFREPPNYGGRGAEEIQDLVGAASYLATIPEVDPAAIAICGHSCGGHMVTNALARHSDLYAAGISYAGVGDWRVEMEMDSGDVMPFRISRRMLLEDLAFESSGVAHLDSWTSPILFVHGDNDLQAAMWPTIEMALALRNKGVPAETLIFPGEDHGFYLHANRRRLALRVWDFLGEHLTAAEGHSRSGGGVNH